MVGPLLVPGVIVEFFWWFVGVVAGRHTDH